MELAVRTLRLPAVDPWAAATAVLAVVAAALALQRALARRGLRPHSNA